MNKHTLSIRNVSSLFLIPFSPLQIQINMEKNLKIINTLQFLTRFVLLDWNVIVHVSLIHFFSSFAFHRATNAVVNALFLFCMLLHILNPSS